MGKAVPFRAVELCPGIYSVCILRLELERPHLEIEISRAFFRLFHEEDLPGHIPDPLSLKLIGNQRSFMDSVILMREISGMHLYNDTSKWSETLSAGKSHYLSEANNDSS